MNTIIMNQDVHTPAFIKADASNKTDNIKQQQTSPKQVRCFSWIHIIGLIAFVGIIVGIIYLLSKLVTPQVVTVVSVIVGFLVLHFVIKVILQVTFMLTHYQVEKQHERSVDELFRQTAAQEKGNHRKRQ